MANETELERMVVYLTGNISQYLKSLDDARKASEENAKKIKDEADKVERSFTNQMTKGMMATSATIKRGLADVATSMSLMRGNFQSVGDALRGIGSIAASIPGPWGQAVSAVIGAGATIVDFLTYRLRRAQEVAREGFMSIATGARTVAQASRDIEMRTLNEALDRAVNQMQVVQQMAHLREQAGILGQAGEAFTGILTFGNAGAVERLMTGADEAQQASPMVRIRKQIEERRRLQQEMLNDPDMRELRLQMAATEVGGGMEDMVRGMGLRVEHRGIMRAMHGRGDVESRIRQGQSAIQRTADRELSARLQAGETLSAEQEAEFRERILRAQVQFAAVTREMNTERITTQLEAATEKHRDQLEGLVDEQVRIEAQRQGATDSEIKAMEQEQKDQRELNRLREEGARPEQIARREGQLASERAMRMSIDAQREANTVMVQGRTPVENYDREMARLGAMLQANRLSQEDYNRAVNRAGDAFRAGFGNAMSLVQRFQDPLVQVEQNLRDLDEAFEKGAIGTEQYQRAVRGMSAEAEKLNQALQGTPAVAANSADALARVTAYTERLRAPRDVREMLANRGRTVTPGGEDDWMYGRGEGRFGADMRGSSPMGSVVDNEPAVQQIDLLTQMRDFLRTLAGRPPVELDTSDLEDANE